MIANQGIGVLGVQDIDTDVEQIEMVNKSRNHVFVQEADSVNVFGQGLRNFNDNGDLMFSTIVDELYIDGKNIRERFPDYSTDGQKVDGYTIDGYTLQDFYLDEGIRIVNGKVHTGKEGYLYVRSSVGDWGPMNYDQLADELSRIRNPEEVIVAAQNAGNIAQFFASGQEDDSLPGGAFDDNQSSEQRLLEDNLFGALSSDLYSPKSEELKMLSFQSLADLLSSQELLLAQGSEDIAIEYEAEVVEIEPSDNTEESVVIENELSDTRQKGEPALGLNGNLQRSIDQQAGDSEVRSFMSIVKRLYGDQVLDEQTLYGIYIKMMTELSGNPVDYETFKMQLSSNSL
ncbi:hypothetical protein [Endozoicomonas atrinae]|uniref:hypothetical protein n=1 Tax=Endozoicomonas atrinae TaxID=1333660 RepID=UPI000824BCF3|nr:hypothetical protein [Endozoicomonas atrinae]